MPKLTFARNSERLAIAVDGAFEGPDARTLAERHLIEHCELFKDLGVTIKVEEVAIIIGGPRTIELVHSYGLKCFLDLKRFATTETLRHSAAWIKYHNPSILTICDRVRPKAFAALKNMLADTCVALVGPLTDHDDEDFYYNADEGNHARAGVVEKFLAHAERATAQGIVCAPKDLPLLEEHHRSLRTVIATAIRIPSRRRDNNSANAGTHLEALQGGADVLVVGRPIMEHTNTRDRLEAAKAILRDIEAHFSPVTA